MRTWRRRILLQLLVNTHSGDTALRAACTGFLDPFARVLGSGGVLLMAFAPGFPANKIVLPVTVMAYMQQGGAVALPALGEPRALPTVIGLIACFIIASVARLFGWA